MGEISWGMWKNMFPHLLIWLEAATSDSEVAVALANVVVCSVLDC